MKIYSNSLAMAPYEFLLQEVIYINDSLIQSRNGTKSLNVIWSLAWQNLLKGLTASEKCFAWKVQGDMLPVGFRIHWKYDERRCLTLLENNTICIEVQTLEHCFSVCPNVSDVYAPL